MPPTAPAVAASVPEGEGLKGTCDCAPDEVDASANNTKTQLKIQCNLTKNKIYNNVSEVSHLFINSRVG